MGPGRDDLGDSAEQGHHPDEDDDLPGSGQRALEAQRVADGPPPLHGYSAQGEH